MLRNFDNEGLWYFTRPSVWSLNDDPIGDERVNEEVCFKFRRSNLMTLFDISIFYF